jgi:NTP pyrophosphatase (non-canonical NTP hydrolase)
MKNIDNNLKDNILDMYARFTPTTFIVPEYQVDAVFAYLFSGLAAEAGEVAGNYAKYVRGDFDINELRNRSFKEIGDVMYFLTQLCNELNIDMYDVIEANMEKLKDRLKRNVIKGSGDER